MLNNSMLSSNALRASASHPNPSNVNHSIRVGAVSFKASVSSKKVVMLMIWNAIAFHARAV
jgi:hypothetical protein